MARHLAAKAGIALLILFTLLSNLHWLLQAAFDPYFPRWDRISQYEKRFEGLKKILPAHGVVGYLSHRQAQDIRFDAETADFYLTQYALAPLIVIYSSERELVIGNFRASGVDLEILTDKNLTLLTLIRDFGNGVMLFRHETP